MTTSTLTKGQERENHNTAGKETSKVGKNDNSVRSNRAMKRSETSLEQHLKKQVKINWVAVF